MLASNRLIQSCKLTAHAPGFSLKDELLFPLNSKWLNCIIPPSSCISKLIHYSASLFLSHTWVFNSSVQQCCTPPAPFSPQQNRDMKKTHIIVRTTSIPFLPHTLCTEQHHLLPWHFSSHLISCSQTKPLSHLVFGLFLREIWWPVNKNNCLL